MAEGSKMKEAPTDPNPLISAVSEASEAPPESLSPEQIRFSSKSPLATLLTLSIGPLMFNTGISLHDAVDLILISRAIGQRSLQIVGFSSLVRFLCMSVTIYFAQASIAKISRLIGEKRPKDAEQVVADLFRIAFLTMLFVALIFFFVAKPMLVFMGCDDATATEARSYLTPILIAMPFISIFQLSCGFLQSQGRSVLTGAMQLTAFALNCGFFSPILLFVVKIPLSLAGISFALSQTIPGLILMFLIFAKKFDLKPSWSLWKNRVSKETWQALYLASPFILNVLANTIPPMFLLRYMMKAAFSQGIASGCGAVFSVFLRLQSAINSISIGINQGLMTSGSYAYGAKLYPRLLTLFKCSFIITLCYHLCWLYPMVFHADVIGSMWLTEAAEKDLAKRMIRIPFETNFLIPINDACVNFLLASGSPGVATSPSFVRGAICLLGTFVFYYTNKNDALRIMRVYNCNDISLFLLDIAIVWKPLSRIINLSKASKPSQLPLLQ